MDNTANSLLNFFFDKSKSIGVKTALTISVLGLLLLVDVGLNLSYNLSLNNKISQLERIQNLKKSYQTDSLKLSEIVRLENEILDKKHYSDYLRFDLSTSNQISNTKNQNANPSNTATKTPNKPKPTIISTFWMVISSNYSLLVMWPFLILLPIFPNQEYKKGYFFGWIALNIVWAGLIALISVIAFQIPIIADNPTYNYWLNFGIHSLFLILIVLVSKKKK
jgi:hypothetical protein